jgi:quercetin dioxygenase-like cupin family protein
MGISARASSLAATLFVALPFMASAQTSPIRETILQQVVPGMPMGKSQEVRVITATFKPGDKTILHTHQFPVTYFVLEGTFRKEMEGSAPVIVKAGQAFVEPPNVKATLFNHSSTEPLRLVIFYASTPGTPFLDPVH